MYNHLNSITTLSVSNDFMRMFRPFWVVSIFKSWTVFEFMANRLINGHVSFRRTLFI